MALKIAGYQLGREVSSETWSSVYNAVEVKTSKTVSVRVFNHTLSANKNFCNEFLDTVSPLLNQSIGVMVAAREAVVDGQNCYLISDYFHGSQLQDNKLNMTTEQILQFAQQLASTLEVLHSKKLVHGGIELSNTVITEQSQMLLGFIAVHKILPSISHISIAATKIKQSMYLAPEASQGLSPATDFYALGVLLFKLLNQQDPFEGCSMKQLDQQKRNFRLRLPKSSLNRLKPLFTQILHPDPKKRIYTAHRFHQAIEAAGYTVMRPVYSVHAFPPTAAPRNNTKHNQPEPESPKNRVIPVTLLVLVLIAISVVVMLPHSRPQITEKAQTDIGGKANTIAQQTLPDEFDDAESRAQSLYEDALASKQLNNLGAALMNANYALKENPDHGAARQLKVEIEQELEARSLIAQAEQQISRRQLTKPPGDNAFETYSQLGTVLSDNDPRPAQGIEKIAAYYYGLAKIELSRNNLNEARSYVQSGYGVLPDYAPLNEIDQAIDEQQKRIALKRQQQRIQAERARQERQRRLEQQLELQRQQELAQQQLARKQQLQAENKEVNLLLKNAKENLKLNNLTLSSITSAKTIYNQLNRMDIDDTRIPGLKQDILDAYGILAVTQKNASRLNSALITIKQGLLMDAQNKELTLIGNEIDALRLRALQNQ
jgi:serine/threonine protein kinase